MLKLKHTHNILFKGFIGLILICATLPIPALADNIRPAYLELEASPSGNIRVVWKVPLGQEIPPQFEPVFPDQFQLIPPANSSKPVMPWLKHGICAATTRA